LLVSADDAARLHLKDDGVLDIGWDGVSLQFPVRVSPGIATGVLHLMGADQVPFGTNPCLVQVRLSNE
jgi:hypothetical protein